MHDLVTRIATICRDRRLALDLTQAEVAGALGISRSHYASIEQARTNPSLGLLDRIGTALGLELHIDARPVLIVLGSRVRDGVHARSVAYVARRLVGAGWIVRREVPFEDGRWRGWIDIMAFDPRTGWLLIIEVKTSIVDIGQVERQIDWYARSARLVIPTDWRVSRVCPWLLLLATAENDLVLARHRDAFAQTFPLRATEMRVVVDATSHPEDDGPPNDPARGSGAAAASGVALIDPRSRRRDWLIAARIDGRRTPSPYPDRSAAARGLGV
jgi:transcriptional regulator with XRE-family HTH domain